MPNLAGIYDPRAEDGRLLAELRPMLDVIDIPAYGYTRRIAQSRGLVCGNVLTGVENNMSQPACRDGAWLMIDGEILNGPELAEELVKRGALAKPVGRELDSAELALAAYWLYGEDFVEHLNGQWNIVLCDEARDITLLVTDRIGSRILFYAEDGDRFVFGSEAKAVVAGRKGRSRAGGPGLLELLLGGQQCGDSTWIEGIRAIDPGTIIRFTRGHAPTRRRYWRFSFAEGGAWRSDQSYAEEFADVLRRATQRAMRRARAQPIALTLSGGLDSRCVALSIGRDQLPIPAITYGDPDSPDVRYARQLASIIGLKHIYIEEERERLLAASRRVLDEILGKPLPSSTSSSASSSASATASAWASASASASAFASPSAEHARGFFGVQVDRIAWRAEGMNSFYGCASMLWHPVYARLMRLMLNGAVGDALTGSHLHPKLLLGRSREQLRADFRRAFFWQPREAVERVLTQEFVRTHWDGLENTVDKAFAGIPAEHPMAISSVIDLENRQRRGAFSTFTIERYFCTCRSPFLDYELAEFLASIPPLYRFEQRVYKKMIVRAFPEARHVPWAYTEALISDSPAYEFLREATNFAIHRAKKLLFPGNGKKRWSFRDNMDLLRKEAELGQFVLDWVSSDGFPSDVFNASGIRALVARFQQTANESDGELFSHLCQIARWHRWGLLSGEAKRIRPECDPSMFGVGVDAVGVGVDGAGVGIGVRARAPTEMPSSAEPPTDHRLSGTSAGSLSTAS